MSREQPFGICIIDKPPSLTSHDVVRVVRRIFGTRRVGHGGTLDPLATGVLPVLIGKATRLASFVQAMDKGYAAEMVLGVETDSQDVTGQVVREQKGCQTTREALQQAASKLVGTIDQLPPMVSAVRVDGKRLYEWKRSGTDVDREARPVTVYDLVIDEHGDDDLAFGSRVSLNVCCSKGTYVRTLCHDIGQLIGCGAAMSKLRRTHVGPYDLSHAMTIEELERRVSESGPAGALLSPTTALWDMLYFVATSDEVTRLRNGQRLAVDQDRIHLDGEGWIYAVDDENQLICMMWYDPDEGVVMPRIVF